MKKKPHPIKEYQRIMRMGKEFLSVIPKPFKEKALSKIKDPTVKVVLQDEHASNFLMGYLLENLIGMLLPAPKKRRKRK